MEYREFFQRFGGSARSKHIRSALLLPVGKNTWKGYKPAFNLPKESGLPKEFIRLCPWEMEFLFAVSRRAKKGVLEVGRFNGGSSFLMSCANDAVPIWSIDIAPQNDQLFLELCRQHKVGGNVHLIVGDSQKTKYPQVGTFDLLYIDGDHTYEGCLADIKNWFPDLSPGGYAVFHDSYISTADNGVQDAILDFIEARDDVEVVVSPLIGAAYWRYPQGSMACIRKKPQARSI